MVKGIVNNTTSYYPGRHYNLEITAAGEKAQKFYFAGGATIAVRTVAGEEDTLQWVLSDHLNSASVTANADGTWNSSIIFASFAVLNLLGGSAMEPTPEPLLHAWYLYDGDGREAFLNVVKGGNPKFFLSFSGIQDILFKQGFWGELKILYCSGYL